MSIQAISWAFSQQLDSPNLKFVLICFANYANEYGTTYCSNRTIQAMTGMDDKTIAKWVKKLEEDGILLDTGKRQGDTGRIKIYKIVAFETHPKTGVLEAAVITPKTEALNTPKNGESPIPPYKDNLKSKPKENNKKKNQVTLEKWEEAIGSQLCVEQMASWVKENRLDPEKIKILIPRFREKMISQGKLYANFVATFQVWLREGWLGMTFPAAQLPAAVVTQVEVIDRGLAL
jgi:hypothetical protein